VPNVNLAARVEQAANDGHIFPTMTIRDMPIGLSHDFNDACCHTLKDPE
jgi:class 3 adenylate cyclase